MRISIVVPIFNVPKLLLDACLESVSKQTLRPDEFEIILVDDCSTDSATLNTLREFARPNSQIIRHPDNRGLNAARHSGVKAATGDYVVFIDGDDILTRDAIESLRMVAHQTNADIVTAPLYRWDPEHKMYADQPFFAKPFPVKYRNRLRAALSVQHSFTMCARLFRRELLSDDVFNLPREVLHEDITTFIRILFKAAIVSHIHRTIYYYTVNSASITSRFSALHADGMFFALDDWIANARRHELYEELFSAMAEGAKILTNRCIEQCIIQEKLTDDDKFEIIRSIGEKYRALPIALTAEKLKGVQFLAWLYEQSTPGEDGSRQKIGEALPTKKCPRASAASVFDKGLIPSATALQLRYKIVFICQVDYQLRNATRFCQELNGRGYNCAILDNSLFASGGTRQLPDDEIGIFSHVDYIKIQNTPYGPDWLSTARLVLAFNDFNDDFREALEYRHRLRMPSVGIVEGINDFMRLDFDDYRYLPYRRSDYVFLAGDNDRKYFEDRKTFVVGLPIIEKLHGKKVSFPERPLAVVNVNFTYGVLENRRAEFISKTREAIEAVGVDWVITQHPMDTADLTSLPVSNQTQYELIDAGSIFISRFATGILEAIASGKPAIYFNPHGEKVEKFKEPFGAFSIATTVSELADAIRQAISDIRAGVDFRKRGAKFLEHHTGYRGAGPSASTRLADAVEEILSESRDKAENLAQLISTTVDEPRATVAPPEQGHVPSEPRALESPVQSPTEIRRRKWWKDPRAIALAIAVAVAVSPFVSPALRPFRVDLWYSAALIAMLTIAGNLFKKTLRRRFFGMSQRLESLEARLAEMENRLAKNDERLDFHGAYLKNHDVFIGGLESRLDNRLEDFDELLEVLDGKVKTLSLPDVSVGLVAALRSMRALWVNPNAGAVAYSKSEHGHGLLMSLLVEEERAKPGTLAGSHLIEIGTTRERFVEQSSTEKLSIFSAITGVKFTTVDVDPIHTERARTFFNNLSLDARAITMKGENYLALYEGSLDFVYLDAFDYDHGKHSQERRARYRDLLQTDINDQECWQMHKLCAQQVSHKMRVGGLVVVDDTWTDQEGTYDGKGRLAVPLLLEKGFEVLAVTTNTVALRRIEIR